MSDRFYRCPEHLHGPDAKPPTFPEVLDGSIKRFNFSLNAWTHAWFFLILDELKTDPGMDWIVDGGSWQQMILEAWTEHRIFGVCIKETDALYNLARSRNEAFQVHKDFFMHNQYTGTADYVLPCFLITSKDKQGSQASFENAGQKHLVQCGDSIEFLWVAPRVRRHGLGTFLARQYPHEFVHDPLAEVTGFWDKLGYTQKSLPPRVIFHKEFKKARY